MAIAFLVVVGGVVVVVAGRTLEEEGQSDGERSREKAVYMARERPSAE